MFTAIQQKLTAINEKSGISPRHTYRPILADNNRFHVYPISLWAGFALRPFLAFLGVAAIATDAYHCAAKQSVGYVWQWFNLSWVSGRGTLVKAVLNGNEPT